ncbi:STY4851/ECs_5259 family protein [Rheinheimera gaetbuli]
MMQNIQTVLNAAITPSDFISTLLKKRGLISPSGQPLFSYQISHEEYLSLREVTKRFYPKTSLTASHHSHWAACFVLFCSEWYRREYQTADGWQWSPIWQELGLQLDQNDLRQIVPMGLELFWKRPVRRFEVSGTRTFLGSVFIEGGLPFQLIRQSDNKFGSLVWRVLKNYFRVELLGIELTELIKQNVTYLPSVFSESESIELIASVIRNLMRLANKVDLNNLEQKPSEQLDKLIPNWREQFPIPLDDETGRELLNNWLEQASSASQSIKNVQTKLTCDHVIDIDTLKIKTKITFPKSLSFNIERSQVSSTRLELGLDEGTKKSAQLGSVYALFDGRVCKVRPRVKSIVVSRGNPHTPLFVELTESGICRDRQEISASAFPIGETPIGFEEINNSLSYCGQSSFSVKAKSIYVLVSATARLESLSGVVDLEKTLSYQGTLLHWYKVFGEVRVQDNGNRYRICTNSTYNSSGAFELSGQELQWETRPTRVYKGLPKVILPDADSQTATNMFEFINDKPKHALKNHEKYGIHTFSLKNAEGDVLLRRKLGVLPDDLMLNFHSTAQGVELHIFTKTTIFVEVVVEGAQCEHSKQEHTHIYFLRVGLKPPSTIRLSISANLGSDPIEITLPFPAAGVFGFDSKGDELGTSLTVPQLLGSKVLLYSAKDYIETFTLSVALKPICRNSPRFESKIKVGNRPVSISLYSFKERIMELFALSALDDGIDVEVEIEIRNGVNAKKYNVRKYITELEIDTTQNIVSFVDTSAIDTFNEQPQAIRIAEPERHSEYLPAKKLGDIVVDRYELLPAMFKGDVWLIIPGVGNDLAFRPRLVNLNGEQEKYAAQRIDTLQSAVRAYHPMSNPDVIGLVMSDMADNIEHRSWGYLRALWKETKHLPLSTFQVWHEIAKNERALTVALFVFEMNEEFIQKLDIELPIFWEMINIDSWKQAIKQYRLFIGRFLPDPKIITSRLDELFLNLTSCVSSFPAPFAHFLIHNRFENKLSITQAEFAFKQCWLQDLKRTNSELEPNDWPILLNGALKKAISNCEVNGLLDCEYHQSSVVYYPAISAAVAAGIMRIEDYVRLDPNAIYEMKKIREFDRDWFGAAYSYFVSLYEKMNKENEA